MEQNDSPILKQASRDDSPAACARHIDNRLKEEKDKSNYREKKKQTRSDNRIVVALAAREGRNISFGNRQMKSSMLYSLSGLVKYGMNRHKKSGMENRKRFYMLYKGMQGEVYGKKDRF